MHESERVNQPWFYYTMVLGLYEPFALVLGAVALVRGARCPSLLPLVLGVWIVVTWIVYSAAGEKAPWLVLHLLWPPLLLASWWVGRWFDEARPLIPRLTVGLLSAGLLTWTACMQFRPPTSAAVSPTIWLSTCRPRPTCGMSPRSPTRPPGGAARGSSWRSSSTQLRLADRLVLAGLYGRALYQERYAGGCRKAQIVLMSPADADLYGIQLPEYVGRRMKLRWWFPEHAYKTWDAGFLGEFLGDPEARSSFIHWLLTREAPPVPTGSFDFVLYVRTDLLQAGPLGPFRL